ncbi:MAG: FAD-dependent monooxygenase [Alphaproteobacteria bacterium]|nr:FAD-dependent monooxygenase [Alphaproteobacteria bacterium]
MESEHRVVIAGAGPVGLVAALALAQHDIPVTVCEAEPELATDLRASTFHPPTLDMLDRFGVSEKLIAQGLIAPTWQYRDRETGPVATFDLGLLGEDTAHPYRVQCEQWKLTRILYDLLEPLPQVEVRFRHRVLGAAQSDDWVTLRVATPDGVESLRGRYLIAADGARSAVRKSQDIEFAGWTLPELFLVLSTPFEFADHLEGLSDVTYLSDPEEWLVLLRVADCWRVLFPSAPDESADQARAEDRVQRRLRGVVAAAQPYEIIHKTLYRVHQRVARSYRRGRVLLAGDAAHINNPLGGMGMNGGIHDAVNLAEKLVQVWRGAPHFLLDRDHRQRRTVAIEHLQAQSLRNRELMNERDPARRRKRHEELRRVVESAEACHAFLLRSSMIDSLRRAEAIA